MKFRRTARAQKLLALEIVDDRGIHADAIGRIIRALALVTLEEFNRHANRVNAILAAAEAAISLADFQARMNAIADLPQPTVQQLVDAIKDRITETPE